MLLDALTPQFAEAQQVPKDDKRLKTEFARVPVAAGLRQDARLPGPAGGRHRQAAGVLVVHENRGLNPHIEDIARRLALENFMAFAPDALFAARRLSGRRGQGARRSFRSSIRPRPARTSSPRRSGLKRRPDSTGKVGVVGFCYGGGIANMLATRVPDLAGAVPFYGTSAAPADAAKIKAPLLIHFAETDERINAGWPAYEDGAQGQQRPYEAYTYPGTQHGFNNDTTPRYDAAAAKLAWSRTIEFFKKNLA